MQETNITRKNAQPHTHENKTVPKDNFSKGHRTAKTIQKRQFAGRCKYEFEKRAALQRSEYSAFEKHRSERKNKNAINKTCV